MFTTIFSNLVMRASGIDLSGISKPEGAPSTIGELAGRVVGVVLPLLGILCVALIIYGAAMYMMSTGDPRKVESARAIISNAVIGLVIALLAYVIKSIVSVALGL